MVTVHRPRFSLEDYLDLEDASPSKHEYLDGIVYAMAGGTALHSALAVQLVIALEAQLRGGPCRIYNSDLRIRIEQTGLITYPDATVICGPPRESPPGKSCYTNPTVIIEVLSPSTEAYDREDKFDHYRRLETLRAYVLVSQAERKVEVRSLVDGDWVNRAYGDGEVAELECIGARLDVRELYALAEIPEA